MSDLLSPQPETALHRKMVDLIGEALSVDGRRANQIVEKLEMLPPVDLALTLDRMRGVREARKRREGVPAQEKAALTAGIMLATVPGGNRARKGLSELVNMLKPGPKKGFFAKRLREAGEEAAVPRRKALEGLDQRPNVEVARGIKAAADANPRSRIKTFKEAQAAASRRQADAALLGTDRHIMRFANKQKLAVMQRGKIVSPVWPNTPDGQRQMRRWIRDHSNE